MLGGLYLISGLSSCSDREMPALQEAPEVEAPEAWHDKTREQPYPKLSNELYLNPTPLILRQSLKTGERVQFALSQNPDFPEAETQFPNPASGACSIRTGGWRKALGTGVTAMWRPTARSMGGASRWSLR